MGGEGFFGHQRYRQLVHNSGRWAASPSCDYCWWQQKKIRKKTESRKQGEKKENTKETCFGLAGYYSFQRKFPKMLLSLNDHTMFSKGLLEISKNLQNLKPNTKKLPPNLQNLEHPCDCTCMPLCAKTKNLDTGQGAGHIFFYGLPASGCVGGFAVPFVPCCAHLTCTCSCRQKSNSNTSTQK